MTPKCFAASIPDLLIPFYFRLRLLCAIPTSLARHHTNVSSAPPARLSASHRVRHAYSVLWIHRTFRFGGDNVAMLGKLFHTFSSFLERHEGPLVCISFGA
mmetsp:Transcript_2561/g.9145  ORF Transcript_2561/g.9145 Transcript_2561/m.9145 type:complete len:101 (-) Transcript_2561:159-461(-)